MNTITKPAVNMVVTSVNKTYSNRVVCNKHFNVKYHRSTGQFSNKQCDDCREIAQRCTFEDIGL